MTWLTWRLHRNEAIAGLILFAGLVGILGFGIRNVDSAWQGAVAGGCTSGAFPAGCEELLSEFHNVQLRWHRLTALLHAIPVAIAAIVALPTLHELERGTLRLAWTQSVSRRRWIAWRVGFALVVVFAVSLVWTLVAAQWREHIMGTPERSLSLQAYALSPIVLMSYGFFALGLVLAIGGVVRRAIPAIVLMAILFAGVQFLMPASVREHFMAPVEAISTEREGTAEQRSGWQIDWSWIDADQKRLSWEAVNEACPPGISAAQYRDCVDDHGFQQYVAYHPADRFLRFQITEAVIYVGLAAILLGFFASRLMRRPA